METQTRFTAKQAVSTQETRVESCAERHPTLLTRSERNLFSHHHLPTLGTRLGRPHPASRRLLPSLRELIAFPFERTVGRHSRKCQRLFQWRTRRNWVPLTGFPSFQFARSLRKWTGGAHVTSGKLTPMKKYFVLRLFLARTTISHLVWSINRT